MKTTITLLLLSAVITLNIQQLYSQGVAVNATGTLPDSSAMLDIFSTTQGLLIPRMKEAEKNAIVNPAFGLTIFNITDTCFYTYAGTFWYSWGCAIDTSAPPLIQQNECDTTYTYHEVINPATGKIWLDRNLGANQVATSKTDYLAYGSLFQWGRLADGHECINWTSSTKGTPVYGATITLSTSKIPPNSLFIINTTGSAFDWLSPQNDTLWQGVNGINNPCPAGFRLPTHSEFVAEHASWSSNDANGAYASPLKFIRSGIHNSDNGNIINAGISGYYWSSTITGVNAYCLSILSIIASSEAQSNRASGYAVRCIKN